MQRSATLQEEFHARTLCIPKAAAPVVHHRLMSLSATRSDNDGSQNEQEGTFHEDFGPFDTTCHRHVYLEVEL
jgi:hypothetical protein